MVARSEESRQAILKATLELLGVGKDPSIGTTVQRLTIEAIAKRAGVSKATIYRWWENKAALALDAFAVEYLPRTPVREDVPFLQALKEHVRKVVLQYAGVDGSLIAQLIAESQYDAGTLEEFHRRFWDARRDAVIALIRRGVNEGVVRPDADPNMVATLIYAPIYQRLLFKDGPLDKRFAADVVAMAMAGVAVTGASSAPIRSTRTARPAKQRVVTAG